MGFRRTIRRILVHVTDRLPLKNKTHQHANICNLCAVERHDPNQLSLHEKIILAGDFNFHMDEP